MIYQNTEESHTKINKDKEAEKAILARKFDL